MKPDPEQKLFGVFKRLFGEWVAEKGFDSVQMQRANAGEFITWCRRLYNLSAEEVQQRGERLLAEAEAERPTPQIMLSEALESVADCPHASAEAAELQKIVRKLLFEDWAIWQLIFVWWPILSLAGRPPLKNRPAFVHLSLTFGFPDGKGVQLTVPTMNQGEEHFKHDGYICSLLRSQTEKVIEGVMENGLDAMYAKFGTTMTDH